MLSTASLVRILMHVCDTDGHLCDNDYCIAAGSIQPTEYQKKQVKLGGFGKKTKQD
jgi:hypothetical protein